MMLKPTPNPSFFLECHIPFFALRANAVQDRRCFNGKPLRARRRLPVLFGDDDVNSVATHYPVDLGIGLPIRSLARNAISCEYYYYEAQISILVTGVNEWFWTSYCVVDTYFDSERIGYVDGSNPRDAASGGGMLSEHPNWNPREYFLIVVSRRLMQSTREWSSLVKIFIQRLNNYVRI